MKKVSSISLNSKSKMSKHTSLKKVLPLKELINSTKLRIFKLYDFESFEASFKINIK